MSLNDSVSQKWLTVNQRYSPLQQSHTAHIQRTNTTRRQQLFAMTRQGNIRTSTKDSIITLSLTAHAAGTIIILFVHGYVDSSRLLEINTLFFLFCYSDKSKFSGASYWRAFNDLKIFLVQQCAWQFGVTSRQVHQKTAMGHSKFYKFCHYLLLLVLTLKTFIEYKIRYS